MAKAKKRVAARKKNLKRDKVRAKPALKKSAKRAAPNKAKPKVRRAAKSTTKVAATENRVLQAALPKAPQLELPIQIPIVEVIEEPAPVVVVAGYESVRMTTPTTPDGEPANREGR
jgi:hypothetical protein